VPKACDKGEGQEALVKTLDCSADFFVGLIKKDTFGLVAHMGARFDRVSAAEDPGDLMNTIDKIGK
jgi:hypothetical protein